MLGIPSCSVEPVHETPSEVVEVPVAWFSANESHDQNNRTASGCSVTS